MTGAGEAREEEAAQPPATSPSEQSVRRADLIIRVLLALVTFVIVVGTVGNLANQSIRVDVALVTALLAALGTYAIAGKLTGK